MKTSLTVVGSLTVTALLACCSITSLAQPPRAPRVEAPKIEVAAAQLPEQQVQDNLMTMLAAIEADDLANFSRPGTEEFKAGLSRKTFDELRNILTLRLEKGYDVIYFGTLKKAPYKIHLWKLVFKNKGDEVLGELSLKDGKVDGFHVR